MKPTLPAPLTVTLPSLAAAGLLAALSAPFALAQSTDSRSDPARGEALDIQNGETRSTHLILPAVQKAREAAGRRRGGVNVAAGDINGDADPATTEGQCDTVQSDIAELRAAVTPSCAPAPDRRAGRQGGDQ